MQAKLSIWNKICWQEFTWCQLTSSNLKTKVVKQFTDSMCVWCEVWEVRGVGSVRPDQQLRGQSLWSVLPTGKIQTDTQCHNCCQHNQGLSLVNWQWSLLLIGRYWYKRQTENKRSLQVLRTLGSKSSDLIYFNEAVK